MARASVRPPPASGRPRRASGRPVQASEFLGGLPEGRGGLPEARGGLLERRGGLPKLAPELRGDLPEARGGFSGLLIFGEATRRVREASPSFGSLLAVRGPRRAPRFQTLLHLPDAGSDNFGAGTGVARRASQD
jgi:hypothetical protein